VDALNAEESDDITFADEAISSWGAAALGVDPLEASFTSEPYAPVRPHVPFYRFVSYPDVLELRSHGFEIDYFAPLFDLLENVRLSDALLLSGMLRNPDSASVWNAKRARQLELSIRQTLHRFGYGRLPRLIRTILIQAFPGETANWITRDLSQMFYWAALARAASSLEWRSSQLSEAARYLEHPVSLVLNWGQDANK
jgi:hypothetical protein